MSRQKTLADREQYVVKANDLIRRTRYSLTAQQQKLVLFAISKIRPDDDINTEYTFDLNELANACGMKIRDGGSYYDRIKEDLDILTKRQWCTMPDGAERTISWIGDAEIVKNDAKVTITFNKYMQPYLFDLKEKYTQYRLQSILVFRGKYAIRLYEIMRSYTTQRALEDDIEKDITITLEDLRYLLDVQGIYPTWREFNRRVIDPAIKEINERAEDIHVEYEPMRGDHTRSIEKINFIITSARIKQVYNAHIARKEKLDHIKIGGGAKK